MTEEEMIEEILMEAHSMGFREELINRVKILLNVECEKRKVNVYEEEFQKMIVEITD